MPISQNIELYRGDTKTLTIQVKSLLGLNFDMTGASAKWWLAINPDSDDGDVLIAKSSAAGDGISIVAPATNGVVTVTLDEDDTDLAPGLFYHELKVFKGAEVATSMRGTVYMRATLSMPPGDPLVATALVPGSPVFGLPTLVSV